MGQFLKLMSLFTIFDFKNIKTVKKNLLLKLWVNDMIAITYHFFGNDIYMIVYHFLGHDIDMISKKN
jgi:hypothetical protein